MHSRYQLARALRREGLPPLEVLRAWARVFHWLLQAEATGESLRQLARRDGLDAATAYRLVRRTTSLRWSQVRRAGLPAMLQQLGLHRTPHVVGPVSSAAPLRRSSTSPSWSIVPHRSLDGPEETGIPPRCSLAASSHPPSRLYQRVTVPGSPFDVAIAPNGTVACVTRLHAAAVDCIQLEPLAIAGTVHTGGAPTRIALTASGTRAYVTNQFAEEVAILDLRRRAQIDVIPICGNPLCAVLSQDERTLYVTTNLDRLHAIGTSTRQVGASVPILMACTNLLLHPSGRRLFVPTYRAGVILEVDARTLQTTRRFTVGGVVQELACSSDGLTLFATNEDGWLDVIHLPTGRHASVRFDSMAHGLAISPDDTVLYVGLLRAGHVAVVDRRSLRTVTTIPTGGQPRRIAFDATGRSAVIANERGWVDLIH